MSSIEVPVNISIGVQSVYIASESSEGTIMAISSMTGDPENIGWLDV